MVLSGFRIVVGFLFTLHGTAHLFGWPVAAYQQPAGALAWWAGLIELFTGLAITFGTGTRIAAFLASGTMAVTYFTQHQANGLLPIQNMGELAALYSWIFLLLTFSGGGPISIDAFLSTRAQRVVGEAAAV